MKIADGSSSWCTTSSSSRTSRRRCSTSGGGGGPEEGRLLNLGYYISGPTFQASAARSYLLTRRLSALLEAKVTASYARVPISGGHASAPNLALHLVAGMGFEL